MGIKKSYSTLFLNTGTPPNTTRMNRDSRASIHITYDTDKSLSTSHSLLINGGKYLHR